MLGLRNISIHEYFGIDFSIIWDVATINLPETKPAITFTGLSPVSMVQLSWTCPPGVLGGPWGRLASHC